MKQIKEEAKRLYKDDGVCGLYRHRERSAYIAGATAQAEKYQNEVDFLKETLSAIRLHVQSLEREIKILDGALDQHLKP